MHELSSEDFLLMGWQSNPRFDYKAQMKRLKNVHQFTFDAREKLIPQRKTAIRKAFNKYNQYLSKIKRGEYTFIDAKKSQVKNLKEQFPHSNKGIIYNRPVQSGAVRKTEIFGTGKHTKLLDEFEYTEVSPVLKDLREFTFYLPWPESLDVDAREIWVDYVNDTLQPNYISMAINGYSGLAAKMPGEAGKYAIDLTDKLGKKGKEILSGIYLIFHRKKGGAWLKRIKQEINSLY